MRPDKPTSNQQLTVTAIANRTRPQPTAVSLADAAPESFGFSAIPSKGYAGH
jgi:hypothetical protein